MDQIGIILLHVLCDCLMAQNRKLEILMVDYSVGQFSTFKGSTIGVSKFLFYIDSLPTPFIDADMSSKIIKLEV